MWNVATTGDVDDWFEQLDVHLAAIKMERQEDIQVMTLRKVVQALGGELELLVRLPTGVVRLTQFGGKKRIGKHIGKRTSGESDLQFSK